MVLHLNVKLHARTEFEVNARSQFLFQHFLVEPFTKTNLSVGKCFGLKVTSGSSVSPRYAKCGGQGRCNSVQFHKICQSGYD